MPEQKVRMSWTTTTRNQQEFTAEQWARFLSGIDLNEEKELPVGFDKDSLDAVYNHLNDGDWQVDEDLNQRASINTWVDSDDPEVTNLEVIESA